MTEITTGIVMATCTNKECGAELPLQEGFYLRRKKFAGSTRRSDYSYLCKGCVKAKSRKWVSEQTWVGGKVRVQRQLLRDDALLLAISFLIEIGGQCEQEKDGVGACNPRWPECRRCRANLLECQLREAFLSGKSSGRDRR